MAFIQEGDAIVSFAEFQDVVNRDQRLFESNEGLSDDIIDTQLTRATERILSKIRASAWWREYYVRRDSSISYNTVADVPEVDAIKIIARQNDFTDLCVYTALSEFILPSIADFGNPENAERQKMGYYKQIGEELYGELITAGDWYDFDGDDTIGSSEKQPGQYNLKRVR
jgi:hypothetical protein